jgi:hypothetical protein
MVTIADRTFCWKKYSHFIYFSQKNQFFVTTSNPNKDKEVKNEIGLYLVNRIVKAYE